MNPRPILSIALAGVIMLLCGCNPKCKVLCEANLSLVPVGYSASEIDTFIVNVYAADGTFSNLQSTFAYPASFRDTTTDTLTNQSYYYAFDLDAVNADLEVIILPGHQLYRFSKITALGDAYQMQPCDEGDPAPGFCTSGYYIISYIFNGVPVMFTANANKGTLYLPK